MGARGGWSPEIAREWQRIVGSAVAVVVGAFMLIWQTVFAAQPNALLVGAGLLALGVPPALRVDKVMRGSNPQPDTEEER